MRRARRTASPRMTFAFGLLAALAPAGTRADPPAFGPDDFPPSVGAAKFTVRVGEQVTVGGPKSMNFLPDEWVDVYVVPHRVWSEGDSLNENAVRRIRVLSDARGGLPLTDLWKPDRAGRFDIVVDYDGDGRFSNGLDALSAFVVRPE